MDKKIIIGLSGEIAAGKSLASKYIIKKYKASYFKLSEPIRKILLNIDQEITRENMNLVATSLRKIFGEDFLIKAIINKIKKEKNKYIIVDGIRKKNEIKKIKKTEKLKLFYITADAKIRYERLVQRTENQGDDKKTFLEFKKEEKEREADKDIYSIKKEADYIIKNEDNLKNFYKNIDLIIKKLK